MSTETDRLERLLRIARDDTGGFRRVVQILLSLWNGDQYRADLQELLYLDSRLFGDIMFLLRYLYEGYLQLDSLVGEEHTRKTAITH
jgi:hypothetical protein